MTIEYILEEKDFLTFQLYTASRSATIKKKRLKNKILVPVIYLAISLFSFYNQNTIMTFGLVVFAVIWFFAYPVWEKQRYINHYKSFIRENYKERLGRSVTLEFNNEYIIGRDGASESKVVTKEIEEINEIAKEIFIKLKTGQTFILPKDRIKNIKEVADMLKALALGLNVAYHVDDKWEWK